MKTYVLRENPKFKITLLEQRNAKFNRFVIPQSSAKMNAKAFIKLCEFKKNMLKYSPLNISLQNFA